MNALVIYDSYFGNTEKVAQAVAQAIGCGPAVKIADLKPEQLQGVDLLVAGSPTRAFNASDATRAFLKGLAPGSLSGVKFAAFDTRVDLKTIKSPFFRWFVGNMGWAANKIAGGLKKAGAMEITAPAGFTVQASEGPLSDGELDRAAAWASKIK